MLISELFETLDTGHRPRYLRVGEFDRSTDKPVSRNFVTGDFEIGLSVYELDADGYPVVPPESEWAETDMRDRLASDEPKYIVTGNLVGWGHDGEPLLSHIEVIGEWQHNPLTGEWNQGSLTEGYAQAPKYWYRGVETVRTSNWKVPDRKLPEDLLTAIEGHRAGDVYALQDHQFKISKTYSGMSNWGFGVYVTNSINWAARYGNNILVCTFDPETIFHITHRDFLDKNPETNGGKLALLLESEVGTSWADQAREMFRIVKKLDRKAKAIFVQTDDIGNGQMCVFNKNYIDAKYFFELAE